MALKNLFDMVKADRYTQDGREEIIKAQEAETEDKVYQIGEISQKTGLQKTANGWVKPKKGAAPAKKEEARKQQRAEGEANARAFQEKVDKGEINPAEEVKTESTAKFETEQENAKYEEGRKGWETVSKERLPDIKKKVEQKIDYYKKYDPYAMLGKRTGLNAAQKKAVEQNMAQAKENLAFFTGQLEGINEQLGATDAAPRVLTGDTRIRVRKA